MNQISLFRSVLCYVVPENVIGPLKGFNYEFKHYENQFWFIVSFTYVHTYVCLYCITQFTLLFDLFHSINIQMIVRLLKQLINRFHYYLDNLFEPLRLAYKSITNICYQYFIPQITRIKFSILCASIYLRQYNYDA